VTTNTRTDFAVCICTNGKHAVTEHVRHASPTRSTQAEIERIYPTGHVIDRDVTWTPWRTA
jgi:hypothetical protein